MGPGFAGMMDALDKFFQDPRMTFTASCSDVFGIDTGMGVLMGEHLVGCMAIGALSGDQQTALQQTFAMNTHGIAGDDLWTFAVDLARSGTFSCVALSAQSWNLSGMGRRIGNSVADITFYTVTI